MVFPIYKRDKLGMSHYYKTAQGHTALENRQLNLNVRQRRLLLLIGTEDFNKLSDQFREKIASAELLQQLEELGLIQFQAHSKSITKPITSPDIRLTEVAELNDDDLSIIHQPSIAQAPVTTKDQTDSQSHEKPKIHIEPLSVMAFEEIKTLMAETLSRYCGLLARQLLDQINNASNIKQLKICQMQWITHLQETRIPPQQLNQQLQQVNFALQQLQLDQ